MAFCNNCGNQLNEGAKFCPNCGSPVLVSAAPSNIPPKDSKYQNQTQRRKWFIYGFGFLAFILFVICGWLLLRNPSSNYSLEALAKVLSDNQDKYQFESFNKYGFAEFYTGNKMGIINTKGEVVAPAVYDKYTNFDLDGYSVKIYPSEGFISLFRDGKYGFIDLKGNEVIPFTYQRSGNFYNGLSKVYNNGKWGFIDKTGKEIIPLVYDDVTDFSDGMAGTSKDGAYMFIDKTGKTIFSLESNFQIVTGFSNGLAVIKDASSRKLGLIDKKGKIVTPCNYSTIYGIRQNELIRVESSGKYGFLDKSGKEVIPCKYKFAHDFSEGLSLIEDMDNDGNDFYIDKTGKIIITLSKYDFYNNDRDFHEGLARVKSNGKYGFIDKTGKEIVQCVYDEAGVFNEGVCCVIKDGKYGFIDKQGNVIIPFIYDKATVFHSGLAFVYKDGIYGYIDKDGNGTFDYDKKSVNTNKDNNVVNHEDNNVNDPIIFFNSLAKDGNNVWSCDFGTIDSVKRKIQHNNTFFFYPETPNTGRLSYNEFEWFETDTSHYSYRVCTAYYTIIDNVITATLSNNVGATIYIKDKQSIALRIEKNGNKIVLKELDGIQNVDYNQKPVYIKDKAKNR